MIIAIANSKGGVGKSTLAVHLAAWLHEQGHRVTLADCDTQQSSSEWIGEAVPDVKAVRLGNPDIILNELPMLSQEADFVVADGPGSNTETSRALLLRADLAIVPCKASMLEVRALAMATEVLRQAQDIRAGKPSAVIVLIPGSPLGLITVGVQVLAGVLLPSATVFLLLLCNDKAVLGPWVNGKALNIFTAAVIAILVILSIVLTASVLFPSIGSGAIIGIMIGGAILAILAGVAFGIVRRIRPPASSTDTVDRRERPTWRMPPIALLSAPKLSGGRRLGLTVLRVYLLLAMVLVIVRVVQLATAH